MIRGDRPADLGGITEAEVLASGYSIEDFKRRLDLARKVAHDSNNIFASQKRWFGEGHEWGEIEIE